MRAPGISAAKKTRMRLNDTLRRAAKLKHSRAGKKTEKEEKDQAVG